MGHIPPHLKMPEGLPEVSGIGARSEEAVEHVAGCGEKTHHRVGAGIEHDATSRPFELRTDHEAASAEGDNGLEQRCASTSRAPQTNLTLCGRISIAGQRQGPTRRAQAPLASRQRLSY